MLGIIPDQAQRAVQKIAAVLAGKLTLMRIQFHIIKAWRERLEENLQNI